MNSNASPEGINGYEAFTGGLSAKDRLIFDNEMATKLWQCAALGVALVWIAGDGSNRVRATI